MKSFFNSTQKLFSQKPWRKIRAYLVVVIALMTLWYVMTVKEIKLNLSSSMPIGIYQKIKPKAFQDKTLHHGDIVAVCLPETIAQIGLAQGYLQKGNCQNHTLPILKTLIAIPGDDVSLSKKAMLVNHTIYIALHQTLDSQGNPTVQLTRFGFYPNINTYWLYGENNTKRSWDSRYFGGIERATIQAVYRPIAVMGRRYPKEKSKAMIETLIIASKQPQQLN